MTARDRTILAAIVLIGAIAAAWMLVVSPERDKASSLNAQIQTLQTQLQSATALVGTGTQARAQFASDYSQLARLGEALPADDNVPSLIYEIQSAAGKTKVDFRSLTMSANASATSAPSASAGGKSTTAQSATASLPPGAAVGAAGFPTEQFSFTFNGDFFRLSGFFNRLQQFVVANNNSINVSGRLMTLNGLSLAPGPNGFPQMAATVSATTYMAPGGVSLSAGATAAGPSGTSSAPTSSKGGSPVVATITPTIR